MKTRTVCLGQTKGCALRQRTWRRGRKGMHAGCSLLKASWISNVQSVQAWFFELALITHPWNAAETPCSTSSLPSCNWTGLPFKAIYRLPPVYVVYAYSLWVLTYWNIVWYAWNVSFTWLAGFHMLHVGHCLMASAMQLLGRCWTSIDVTRDLVGLSDKIRKIWSQWVAIHFAAAVQSQCTLQ